MAVRKTEEKKSVEAMLARLEEVVRLLEKGDQPLDGSLALYEEGCTLIRESMMALDQAEQTVLKWQKTVDGKAVETPFLTDGE